MAGQKFTLTFDANLNVSQMKGALGQIQSALNGLHLPQNITKGLQGSFDNLSKEIQSFEAALSKDITSKADFTKLNKQAEKVTSAFEKLKLQVKDITGLSNKDLERLLPSNIVQNINKATKAMDQYDKSTTQAASKVKEIQAEVEKLNQKIANVSNKTPITDIEWKQLNAAIKDASNEVEQYKTALAAAEENQRKIASSLKQPEKSSTWREARNEVTALTQKLEEAKNKVKELSSKKANSITFTKQAEDLNKFNAQLTETQTKLQAAQQALAALQSGSAGGGLKELIDQVSQLTGLNLSNFTGNIEDLRNVIRQFASGEIDKLRGGFEQLRGSVDGATPAMRDFGYTMRQGSAEAEQLDARMRDVSALKSRIQYFFGLNNTINLFRNAVRGAFETIKELDKAMTETAVVTNFSVGDMWKQLPEYTKRANELGVTTKAAYEAATLYYQQGLTTEEVNALSVETLKMARIAGLDAAEATDRMTNALRGFNMELDEVNAQRVDDVYSKLAAISASNVDEISTAMTKVASLAHNAGMEFETTAAFLAQIIETTRESAETAGTALKTVVARFAEVKKLVGEGDLKGQDEEGELIDVNKVSAALRTAGIDLNRYFLGEVGIDDIFMELAEKWDSLTQLQQRYIATQAAGSRQQSRFIALMSDYARTQELVGAAYEANGAAAQQFAKTQESLESKLARLKNAWNEFLMGLTNSTVVKAGVDLLTTLLNIVNKLTGAFGEGVGSVLKWTAAIAALRGIGSFVAEGGGLAKLLGVVTGGKGLAAGGIGKGLGLGAGSLWTGLKNLGYGMGAVGSGGAASGAALTGGAGIAAGLTGIVTALGAIAAAVGIVVAAYKAWEKFTPQGQLKVATKLAEKQEEIAKQAADISKSYKDVQENYKEYADAVKEATNATEQDAAVKSQNDYILSLIEKDSSYAKYLQSRTENGKIVLSLNSETLAKDAEEAAKKAVEESTKSYFANAEQQRKQAIVQARNTQTYAQQAAEEEMYYGTAYEMRAKQQSAEIAKESANASMAAQARLGYQQMLTDSALSSENADLLATVLSQVFEQTGQISDSTLAALTSWAASADAQKVMSLLTGDIGEANLLGDLSDEQLLEAVGLEEVSELLNQFADYLGIGNKELRKTVLNTAQVNKQLQENNRERLLTKLSGLGITDSGSFFENTTQSLQQAVLNALTGAESLLGESEQQALANILINPEKTEEDVLALQSFINSINFDKPVASYLKLQEALSSGNDDIATLAQTVLNSNQQIFNFTNLLRTGLSEAYEEIQEDVQNLIKKNGEIKTDDIDDLAESSSALSKILKAGIIDASTLAKTLTLVGNGRIGFNELNKSLVEVLSNAYTFNDIINDIHNLIANFDEGIDYGEGVDFLTDKTKELSELIENFEFGNQRTERLWNLLFGEDYQTAWARGEDYIRTRVQQMTGWLDNDAYGFFSDKGIMSALGITEAGDHRLNWDISGYDDYNTLLGDITGKTGVSTNAAKMFLTAFASHGDQDFNKQLQDISFNSIAKAVEGSYKVQSGKTILKESDIQALADQYGYTYDQVLEALKNRITDSEKNLIVADQQGIYGQDLYDYFVKQFGGENFDPTEFTQKFFKDGIFDVTQLKSYLSSIGFTDPNQQADLVSSIAKSAGLEGKEIKLNNLSFEIANVLGVQVTDPVVDQIMSEIETQLSTKGEVDLKTLNIFIAGLGIDEANKEGLRRIIASNIKSGDIELDTVNAALDELTLSEEDKKSVRDAIANSIRADGTIDLATLQTTLEGLNLPVGTISTILNALSEDFIGTGLNLNGIEAQLTTLPLDEESKGKIPDILNAIAESIRVDGTIDLKQLNASLQGLKLPYGTISSILGTVADDFIANGISLQGLAASLNSLPLDPATQAKIPDILIALATSIKNGNSLDLDGITTTLTSLGLTEDEIDLLIGQIQGWIDENQLKVPKPDTKEFNDEINKSKGILQSLKDAWAEWQEDPNNVKNRRWQAYRYLSDGLSDLYSAGIDLVSNVKDGINEATSQDMHAGSVTLATNAKNAILDADLDGTIDEEVAKSTVGDILKEKLIEAGAPAGTEVTDIIVTDVGNGNYLIQVDWQWRDGVGPQVGSLGASAEGGAVSRAAGGNQLQPGPALTGEEAPEIVWNKERGYAYVTGQNGPEFRNLNPGDRVFDAAETRRIFRNSMAKGGLIPSYATGRWNPEKDNGAGGGSGSGSGSDKDDKGTEWKNEIDWIYNLMEDIAELERKQTKLQEDYEDYLQDEAKTGKDLYNLLVQQLGNLYTQLNHQQAALELREREMREFMDTTNGFDDLLWYNWNDRTLEIDWDQIEAIQDKDTYDKVSDLVSEAESIQKKMDDAEDSIADIKNQIQELENIWRDTYVDFESRVFNAIVSYYQEVIDNYSELNNTLNNSNSEILNAIQKQIQLERQIRDNTQTEQQISDTEAQLAFLRRDTTGGNELASLQLQKELSDQRESYEDNLIDQAISRLQDDNQAASEQRQKQIDIMQAQLDYQQQSGEFNAYVRELLETAMGADGELLTNSDLMTLLKDQENWSAMSEVSKQVWEEELNTTFKEVAAFILKQNAEENGTFISALTGAIEGMTSAIGSKSQPSIKIDYSAGSGGGGGGGSGGGMAVGSQKTDVKADQVYVYTGGSGGYVDRAKGAKLTAQDIIYSGYFATGGLSTKTGPAWLDGTPSEPEYVLNARQTDAFLRLADILPSMMQSGNITNSTAFGGVNLNLVMNVDQIASDYDVDRIADRVKDIVYNAGQYRNVNTLNFIR